MRSPISRPSKMHPKWDGPFVVLEITDKDVCQLATPNGYILNHLVNKARLRKLEEAEAEHFIDALWHASERLKRHDEREKQRTELNDLDIQLSKATADLLERQKQGKPVNLDAQAQISQRRQEIKQAQAVAIANLDANKPSEPPRRPLRLRRPTIKVREAAYP
jgi:hypothetical protein